VPVLLNSTARSEFDYSEKITSTQNMTIEKPPLKCGAFHMFGAMHYEHNITKLLPFPISSTPGCTEGNFLGDKVMLVPV
jgi:hypothetical protein